ncbi:MAG: tetratricopeptide repeat protein [Lachnospiraceae bacterium]|nr:tetratricopeptide repeat protein [Lachnospiraceae bacterium]
MDRVAKRKLEVAKEKAVAKAMKKVTKLKKKQTKKLRWQRRLGIVMGIGGTCVVAVAAAVMIFPVVDYVKGRIALMKKDYTEAEHLFSQCGKFLDSLSCRQEALYGYGTECYAAKEYQDAYNAFAECGEYKDCVERTEEMRRTGLAG